MNHRTAVRRLAAAREALAALEVPSLPADAQTRLDDVRARLDRALDLVDDLTAQVFVLQEQNQQLRRDLADKVCARICTRPYRAAP